MDKFLLEMFTVVVETRRVTNAAKLLNLTQPAVSHQIRRLEAYFGVPLLTRNPQGAMPTPAGEILYRHAKEILSQYDRMEREIDDLTHADELETVIGATPTAGNFALPCSLWTFKDRFPKANIRLEVSSCSELSDRVLDGTVHMAVIEGPVSERVTSVVGVKCRAIAGDYLVIVTPAKGPWDKGRLTLEALTSVPLILPGKGMGMRVVFEETLQSYGLNVKDLHVKTQLGGLEGMKAALETHGGVLLCTRMAVQNELRRGALKDITPEGLTMPLPFHLVCREEQLQPIARRFVRFIAAPEELESCWTT
ncbi:MAG TPA: LysR family transcriptional regulator [Symbiobacteriaceae bacterium]